MVFKIKLIISGIICGIILLQTSIIAPSIFKYLDQNQTRDLLRGIFPKFFLFILLLASFSLAMGIIDDLKLDIQTIIAALTVFLSVLCYIIIPSTNEAKDKNDQNRFKLLHNVSVISTLIILIANLSLVFFNI
tara:strand:- start:2069 stop:2467 length:399 start_codon:yes stop_codon:yes gene_type:complete